MRLFGGAVFSSLETLQVKSNTEMSVFSKTVMEQKYSQTKAAGTKETWEEIAYRVARNVLKSVNATKQQIDSTAQVIAQRKFIPGGRYLYASGRPFHQTQNCLLMRAEDSREGWADHLQKCAMALMTGAGIGIDYSSIREEGAPIKRTGGFATGPIALMQMTNECGRGIMQGGSRRSAIWAGLNWSHPDIHKFIAMKNWSQEVRAMKDKDFNFPATMDGTNISVQLDDEFFKAYHNASHKLHAHAHSVYWATVKQMLQTAEPGFSVDCGENAGETLRNAPVSANTSVTTIGGVEKVRNIVDKPKMVWTGRQWAPNVVFKKTGENVPVVKVTMTGGRSLTCDPSHPFIVEKFIGKGERRKLVELSRVPASDLKEGDILHTSLPDVEGNSLDKELLNRESKIKVVSVEDAGREDVFCADVMVPEHTFMAEGVIISNCTEVTSRDDSDICNLGSINMAMIESPEEMQTVTELGTQFLLAGTVYSDVPFQKVAEVRTRNRRLGLGLMGLHEWMLKRGLKYGPSDDLAKYLDIYATSTEIASKQALMWGLSEPVKTRAIAPTGTIGIVAETTTGVEPIFCVAYKRRYLKGSVWHYQYVLDPTAKRLIDAGTPWDSIEDAYSLAENPERRVAFQAWLQQYVDHSISSTLNLPVWGSELNNEGRVQEFGKMLIQYLPKLRGITCYPDGARGGQPLTPVKYATAIKHVGEIFVEAMDICDLTKGGSCGS